MVVPLLAAAALIVSVAADHASSASQRKCSGASVAGVVNGKRQCLAPGKKCSSAFGRAYARYGFRCRFGVLWRDPWARLVLRVLHLPALGAGEPCPRTPANRVSPPWGFALDDGTPPYPVAYLDADGSVRYRQTEVNADGWLYHKTIWIAPVAFRGRVLVRGGRLRTPLRLKFSAGEPARLASRELRLTFQGSEFEAGWQEALGPRYTLIHAPGCYAFQVDGNDFSKTLVFSAEVVAE
jgi:hypothetical protein